MSTASPCRRRSIIPADLRPEHVVAIIDTREQLPLDLSPLQSVAGSLTTGDYSVRGLESIIAIERKGLSDLLGCVGQERERLTARFYGYWPIPSGPWWSRRHGLIWSKGSGGHTSAPRRPLGACWGGLPPGSRSSWQATTSGQGSTFPACSTPRPGDGGARQGNWCKASWNRMRLA